ncbi:MAG: hypothetical protein ACRCTJ_07135 [Brevinema sp.]
MKQKILFLLNILIFNIAWSLEFDLKKYSRRPDLAVKILEKNPQLWINNPTMSYYFAKFLHQTGNYFRSNELFFDILKNEKNSYRRNNLYFLIAQNYDFLKNSNKARFYFDKINIKSYYHLYTYAKFEEYQSNFSKSLTLYEKALLKTKAPYIIKRYLRTLEKALLYYKKHDPILFKKYLEIAKNHPDFPNLQFIVIKKSIVL